jgi:hypothetical protein
MSGIHARERNISELPSLASPTPAPAATEARQLQVMQDLLYDILATGLDAERSDVSVELIERFLHEHARAPKTLAQFRAFFAQHGLTGRITAPSAPDIGSLPPLLRVAPASARKAAAPEQAPPSSAEPLRADALVTALAFDADESHPVRFDLPPPLPSKRSGSSARYLTSLALALGFLVVGASVYAGALHLLEMRAELARSEEKALENRALIETLRSQTVGLESSLAANGELIQRMEQKSDLVLDSLEQAAAQSKRPKWTPKH